MGACSSRLIYLKGCNTPLNIGKQIVKNGNDGEPMYLYLITNCQVSPRCTISKAIC